MRFTVLLLILSHPLLAAADEGPKIYLIGNSLTWDTIPSRLEGDVQWHVDCGKSLKFIYENPDEPCVKTSTLWPAALKERKYDIISVQPHYGTTLAEDVETISKWVALQPQATFIIHTGWARSATLLDEYADEVTGETLQHSPAYFDRLIETLQRQHPGAEFRTTHCMRLLVELAQSIDSRQTPFSNIESVYRDAIHMTLSGGRYLMHNAMRETLGQPRVTDGFEELTAQQRSILDELLDRRRTWERSIPNQRAAAIGGTPDEVSPLSPISGE